MKLEEIRRRDKFNYNSYQKVNSAYDQAVNDCHELLTHIDHLYQLIDKYTHRMYGSGRVRVEPGWIDGAWDEADEAAARLDSVCKDVPPP